MKHILKVISMVHQNYFMTIPQNSRPRVMETVTNGHLQQQYGGIASGVSTFRSRGIFWKQC